MSKPCISVLMPVFNQADLVEETLATLFADDAEVLEVLVGNDASRDTTAEVLAKCQKKYGKKMKVFNHKANLGVTRNFNFLLEQAQGEFVALTGGDDLFRPGRFALQLAALRANPDAGICHGNMNTFESETRDSLGLFHPADADPASLENFERMLVENYIGGPSVMVRKSKVPAHGFEPSIPIASDWMFNLETGVHGIVYVPEVLMDYRKSHLNVSRDHSKMYADAEVTLSLAKARFPQHARAAAKGLARVYRARAMQAVLNAKPREAARRWAEAVRLHPTAPSLWIAGAVVGVAAMEYAATKSNALSTQLISTLRRQAHG